MSSSSSNKRAKPDSDKIAEPDGDNAAAATSSPTPNPSWFVMAKHLIKGASADSQLQSLERQVALLQQAIKKRRYQLFADIGDLVSLESASEQKEGDYECIERSVDAMFLIGPKKKSLDMQFANNYQSEYSVESRLFHYIESSLYIEPDSVLVQFFRSCGFPSSEIAKPRALLCKIINRCIRLVNERYKEAEMALGIKEGEFDNMAPFKEVDVGTNASKVDKP